MNKKSLTEADIRTKFITPAIEAAGWDKVTQMREEYFFTAGRITASRATAKNLLEALVAELSAP